MKSAVFKRNATSWLRDAASPVLLTLAIFLIIFFGLRQADTSSRAEGLRVLKEGILNAAVRCYAVEGSYPDDLSYLEERYGVFIDTTKYVVHYDVFASNMLPDITVIENQ